MLKRFPAAPREARTVSTENNIPQTLAPIPYGTISLFSLSPTRTDLSYRYYHLNCVFGFWCGWEKRELAYFFLIEREKDKEREREIDNWCEKREEG